MDKTPDRQSTWTAKPGENGKRRADMSAALTVVIRRS
jgi:hypothetical protein